jgi:hypothetical protein
MVTKSVFHIVGLMKSRSISILILVCAAGRMIDARHIFPLWRDFVVRRQTGHVDEALALVFTKPPAVRTSPSLAVLRREADEVIHVELPNTLGAKQNCSKLRRESKVITSLRTWHRIAKRRTATLRDVVTQRSLAVHECASSVQSAGRCRAT